MVLLLIYFLLILGIGAHRDLPVLTHLCPARRSSVLARRPGRRRGRGADGGHIRCGAAQGGRARRGGGDDRVPALRRGVGHHRADPERRCWTGLRMTAGETSMFVDMLHSPDFLVYDVPGTMDQLVARVGLMVPDPIWHKVLDRKGTRLTSS